jgi:hypothetical protein
MKIGGPNTQPIDMFSENVEDMEPILKDGHVSTPKAEGKPTESKDTFSGGNKVDDSFGKMWDRAWSKKIDVKPWTTETKTTEGDKSTTVKSENNGLDKYKTTTTEDKKGDVTFTRTNVQRNGRTVKSSNSSSSSNGNITTTQTTDKTFRRDGSVRQEQFTQGIKTSYGDNASIERTITQKGTHASETIKSEFKQGNTTRTDTLTKASGAQVNRDGWDRSTQHIQDGRFVNTREVTYSNKRETGKQTEISRDLRKNPLSTEAQTARNEKMEKRQKNFGRAQMGLDIAAELGLRKKLAGGKSETGTVKGGVLVDNKNVSADGKTETTQFVGGKAFAREAHTLEAGADGIRARGKAQAVAGYYAEATGKTTGDLGTASGHVRARLGQVSAVAEGDARLDLNGLNATGKVSVGAEVSVEAYGKYETPSVNIAGVDLNASVDAKGKAGLYAEAKAQGTVAITGNPPRAVIEGEAGASAVAKAEGFVRAKAGPFGIKAEGYVSAGAEAKVSGGVGYDDGKLKLSFGAGAALGVGAGGKVEVEVDVKQIGEMAVNTAKAVGEAAHDAADIDGDGKLSLNDVSAGAEAVGGAIADGAEAAYDGAKSLLSSGAKWVSSWF